MFTSMCILFRCGNENVWMNEKGTQANHKMSTKITRKNEEMSWMTKLGNKIIIHNMQSIHLSKKFGVVHCNYNIR